MNFAYRRDFSRYIYIYSPIFHFLQVEKQTEQFLEILLHWGGNYQTFDDNTVFNLIITHH